MILVSALLRHILDKVVKGDYYCPLKSQLTKLVSSIKKICGSDIYVEICKLSKKSLGFDPLHLPSKQWLLECLHTLD